MPNRLPVFFVLLLLSGLLLAAAGAQGASAVPVASISAFEEDFEGLEDELEEEESEEGAIEAECETALEEADEGELGPDEVDEICAEAAEAGKRKKNAGKNAGSNSVAPKECLLRSAHAHAVDTGDKLKLTIGYTAYEPVAARIEVRKGSSRIATMRRQLGRSGVLRIVKNLGDGKAPKQLVVRLAVPASPGYCGKYETEKVPVH
jgi:hypothetical protein